MSRRDWDDETHIPHQPFYKDERIFGQRITVSLSLRLLIMAVVMFVFTMGFVVWRLIDDQSRFHDLVDTYHQSRLDDQKRTDQKIMDLACLAVAAFPDSESPLIKSLRAEYHCDAYHKQSNFRG